MMDLELARSCCLKLPEVIEYDHFGKPAYRVKKKIFATLDLKKKRVVFKLSQNEQGQFCEKYFPVVFPVKGAWGKFGWTYMELNKISETVFEEAAISAWRNVAPKSLSNRFK
jgi:hypothetical protein